MATLTEGRHAGGFLVWEAFRDYSRDTVTLASGAGNLAPGTVLGKITTGGKFTQLAPAATNGSQTAAGILWGAVDATDADAPGVVVLRGPAIVNRHEVIWPDGATEAQITAATTALSTLGILLR
ncbi:head decoration protein [Ruixingdingia sedimenti]|uniref:Head decoration protein n=1 Tax=Ruixingdingia sedimenti TaxID=3073604 RepID=A0ABU1FBG8_9RHOB|nr:head decoration protein [Xinfangfangia sp. LG-4]MDR5654244.1 head decoration protein [Xinfangfangia sp. LG-4]